jgi:aspartate/methionine/tyrosine aminotransferase
MNLDTLNPNVLPVGPIRRQHLMNPIAAELNQTLDEGNPHVAAMLSSIGRNLFFPKGILSQGAEAKEKAYRMNATVGIATDADGIMHFPSVMKEICGLKPEDAITYAPSYGLLGLRQAWQEALREKNRSLAGREISLPVVTSGITHGLSVFSDLWVDPGDLVLLPDPMWGNYNMIFSVRKGADIRPYPLFAEDLSFDLTGFEAALRSAARERDKIVVLLNFPHNPSGYTVSREEGRRIADILTDIAGGGTGVVAAFDDSYFGLFYEEETLKESLFAAVAGRDPRLLAVKLDGATKENFVWGLRVGFITYGADIEGDPGAFFGALEKKTAGCVRGSISNASHLGQSIVLKSMQNPDYSAEKAEKFEILKKRARRVKAVLSHPRYADAWDVYPFNSGYFMCIRLKTVNAEALRVHLLDTYGVGLISLGESNLRVAFSCLEEKDIEALFETIYKGIADLS